MRHFVAATFVAASAVLGANSSSAHDASVQNPFIRDVVPGAFIVELGSTSGKRALHDEFLGELDRRAAGKFTTRKKYISPIFNGIAVQLKTPEDIVDLASIPNVVSVRPVFKYPAPEPVHLHVAPGPVDTAVVPYGQSVHTMTGVDKVHTQGFTGKGVKIGIIDSGVDYMHSSLGGGFGPGFKVAGGYDFVGDEYYPGQIPPQPDDDPLDTCAGHGTHVAGIVGANPGNEYNITGVAYDANLYAYRVFGCTDATSDDILIEAMLRAYDDGMDIITMSIGRSSAWSDEPVSVVASRIAALGTVVTISAGNEGRSGPFFTSAPASGKDVIAVGSVENTVRMYQTLTASVDHAPIPYLAIDPISGLDGAPFEAPETPLPIYSLSMDPLSRATACSELGDDVPDLSGYIVVFRSAEYSPGSTCFLEDQIVNLGSKGARTFMIYDADGYPFVWEFEPHIVFLRDRDDGVFLVNEFNKGRTITVSFAQHGSAVEIPNSETGGLMSSYSSFGPTQDLLLKPALSAPGGNITSTWLTNAGSWAVASGTSMSNPYMAGSAALLIQARGKAIAKNTRSVFQTTAVGLPVSRNSKALPQTLSHQGAGMINVFNALNVKTEVSPGELLLNDTAHWKSQHRIVIKNAGKRKQTYLLSHQPSGTALTMPTSHLTTTYPVPLVNAPVTVRLSQTRLTLAPGASATVTVNITPPKNVDPKTLPLVSGWLRIAGSLGDRLQVSYLGVAGSMYDAETISTENAGQFGPSFNLPSAILPQGFDDFEDFPQIGPVNFTRGRAASSFSFILAQNSARVVVDLIDANTKVHATVPILNQKRSIWSGWWLPGMPIDKTGGDFDDIPIVTRIADGTNALHIFSGISPIYGVYFPYYVNDTDIPYGQYRYLLRALRPFGNAQLEKDYDVYVTDTIGIVEDA
ncbi:subtilisin-like protein [Auricularia subglabra TFB-10046 SS5]|uniref:Subtilisin-like protein n=1 Tax=Auricularia subglabra (strain TFB-10046 / SS5) TaxID=717982 RepID=J0WU03_AURST|nr:subtilisin-like protein [Auricularia subglabra TFB-10046 SS5]